MKKSLGEGMLSRSSQPAAAADGSSTSRSHLSYADSQADWADPGGPGAAAKGAEHVGSATFASGLRGLLGGASSRLLGSLMGRASSSSKADADEEEEELWFTSLDDFKPICHMLHRGRYMTAYFACANKTGQHFLLKKYDKHKTVPAEERGVRRSIAFSELLRHPNLVRCMGQWEEADIIYVEEEYVGKSDMFMEEYVGKGDIFNDCISHPEKYTERHVAVSLVKPLLKALAYLHANNIIHRSVLPENLYMGIDDVARLGHLTLAVDQLSDRPKSRTALLDYMAPEMLSVKPHNEHELALGLLDDSSSESGADEEDEPSQQQQQQQQQQLGASLQPASGDGGRGSKQAAARPRSSSGGGGNSSSGGQQPSRQGSRSIPMLQDEGCDAAALQPAGSSMSKLMRSSRSLNAAAAAGRAEWEHRDYYDEKVDIWQVGCMVHELLCGSMPFEVESKIDSAGLALWADIEQPPGSLPPDCVDFLQQVLAKDPRQRPSAEQLQEHPWLARCEAGEPGAGCEPLMKRTTRKLQEVDTIPGLGAAASGLMAGFNGLGNMGQMFSRVGQFFQNLRPAAGAARTARGGSDGATELTPVREPASAPRPSRSSDRLESGRPSADRSSDRTDRPSRLERRDRDDDNDSRDDSRGSRRDTLGSLTAVLLVSSAAY
ncbi:hypothetical protein OEZ85_005274 [Tetradesmus obliquus]|uniref:Protein kinase domain-containing protein n=1 Tax=Tetradesmus obliquus TaxID=3088 RepID=A0ABY8UHC7_TETOB|nr:hypothetical protein OEZ85_005274 [Tetradesmus obliquus]